MKRLCALLLAILCLVPRLAFADVAFDGTCTLYTAAEATANHDVSHTVGASANFLIVFTGNDSDTNEGSSMTWDFGGTAQAMTELAAIEPSVGLMSGEAYILTNPTTGTLTARYVTTESSINVQYAICDFTGVDTGSPTGTVVEQESTASQSGSSLAFTVNTGGLAIAMLFGHSAWTNFAQGADQTQIFNSTAIAQYVLTHATVSPMNYTWNATGIDFWHVVVPINAAQPATKKARLTIVE